MLHRKCLISTVNVLLHLAIALSCTPTAAALLKSIHISVESVSTQDLPVDGPGSSLGSPESVATKHAETLDATDECLNC
jgi:hypothetical protein